MSELLFVEIFSYHVHSSRISYKYYIVSKFLRTHMKMEDRSITIDYQLRFSDSHNYNIFPNIVFSC